ncbi:hypothetical protein H8A97_32650 [Bradyrhizobium sp. Arg62]|nr:hypothetical protein [Bradyrhizobium brasilense]
MSVADELGFPDSSAQFDVQFVGLAVAPAVYFEMLGLATGRTHRFEPGRASGLDRCGGVCGFVVGVLGLLLVLDRHARAIAREMRHLELRRLLLAFQFDIGSDPELDEVCSMRREIGKHHAFRGLNHKAVRKTCTILPDNLIWSSDILIS